MIYHFSTKVSPSQVQNCNHLIVTVDGLGDENKNHTVCAFQRKFLETGVFSNLKKRTTIFMEVEHTKFSWDADFGLIRRCESKGDTESILDVAEMIKRSTLSSGRNQVVLFNPKYFKHWEQYKRFHPISQIRKKEHDAVYSDKWDGTYSHENWIQWSMDWSRRIDYDWENLA